MKKLYVLKVAIIVVLTIIITVLDLVKIFGEKKLSRLSWPMKFLRHYLIGSGKAIRIPAWIVKEGQQAMKEAILRASAYAEDHWAYNACDPYADKYEGRVCRPYCVYHSTLYNGSGFYGRPILFYLMGGFTFRLYCQNGQFMVSGKDHYDWHATLDRDGNPQYFTSPLGDSRVMVFLVHLMGKLFGDEYFVTDGFPTGEAGISNKLWEDFKLVGAKEFNSFFVNQPIDVVTIDDVDFSAFEGCEEDGFIVEENNDEQYIAYKCDNSPFIVCLERWTEEYGLESQDYVLVEKAFNLSK